MGPKTVHDIPVKEVIGWIADPGGECPSRIAAGRDWTDSPEKFGGNWAAIDCVGGGCRGWIKNHPAVTAIAPVLPFHAGEETDKAVIVIHRPAIKRMVMALGTLHPYAKKQLRKIGRHQFGVKLVVVDQHRVEAGLAVDVRAANSGGHVGHHLVEGPVGRHLLPEPSHEGVGRFVRVGPAGVVHAGNPAEFGPEGGVVVGEVLTGQQGVDLLGSFVGRTVVHEGVVLRHGRRPGRKIEGDPA